MLSEIIEGTRMFLDWYLGVIYLHQLPQNKGGME